MNLKCPNHPQGATPSISAIILKTRKFPSLAVKRWARKDGDHPSLAVKVLTLLRYFRNCKGVLVMSFIFNIVVTSATALIFMAFLYTDTCNNKRIRLKQ